MKVLLATFWLGLLGVGVLAMMVRLFIQRPDAVWITLIVCGIMGAYVATMWAVNILMKR